MGTVMIPRSRLRLTTLFLFLVSSSAWAQSAAEGTIRGSVNDNQGGALTGVVLTATSPAAPTPSTALTDGQGFYRLLGLKPGEYVLTASLPGFAKYQRTGIDVRAEVNIQLDVTMEIGRVDEMITVAGDTPMLEVQKTQPELRRLREAPR
jgi:hypothetical protein